MHCPHTQSAEGNGKSLITETWTVLLRAQQVLLIKMADEDFDEDIHGDDEEGEIDTGVQLGFMTETRNVMFADSNWENWDGGKVGGKPVWLNSVGIPAPTDLICKCCNSPLIFLLQIYCPLDDVNDAFHRSLYIFVCRRQSCVKNGSVRCFRNQLGRRNDFYPYDPKTIDQKHGKSALKLPRLCALCGCRALSSCSKCRVVSYCCREHQAADWRSHKQNCKSGTLISDTLSATATASVLTDTSTLSPTIEKAHSASIIDGEEVPLIDNDTVASNAAMTNNLTFPEFDLSISAEILEDLEKVDALSKSVLEASIWENASTVEVDDCSDDEDEKDDAHLTQTDYNTALGNEASDIIYTKFMERVRRGGNNQVLRYIRWDDIEGPLILSSCDTATGAQKNEKISSEMDLGPINPTNFISEKFGKSNSFLGCCENCGNDRRFEFQIMPQMLHYLRVDKRTKIGNNNNSNNYPPLSTISEDKEVVDDDIPISSIQKDYNDNIDNEKILIENKMDEDLDWGTLDVYTCIASCSPSTIKPEDSTYLEEFVYVQQPMSFFRTQPVQK